MSSTLRALITVVAFAGAIASSAPVRADTLGPLLPARVMEAGVAYRLIDRTVGYTPDYSRERRETDIKQNDYAFFGRYGLSANATFSFELSATPGELVFEDGEGTLYLVGGALQLGIWSNADYALSFGFHYASLYFRSDKPDYQDIEEQLLEWTMQLQRSWTAGSVAGYVWAGPIASHFSLRGQLPFEDSYQEANEMYGVLVGANACFVRHIGVEAQFLYIETAESHVALFYRF